MTFKTITKLRDQGEFAAETAKLARFHETLAALDQERGEINAQSAQAKAKPADPVAAAVAMLDGQTEADESRSHRLTEIHREETLLRDAVTAQREICEAVAARLSFNVCQTFKPEHQATAKRLLDALVELDEAQAEAEALASHIEGAGYSSAALPNLTWPIVGRINDTNGSLAFYKHRELRGIVR